MTEAELNAPVLQAKRRQLDVAKLVMSSIAAVAATAALVVSLLLLVQVRTVTGTISDCTTPTGRCYQQAQRQNASNRARLVNAAVAAQFCGRRSSTLEQLHACVTRTLESIGDR